MAVGCSALPQISGQHIKGGWLTIGSSSEEQEEEQQQQGPLQTWVAPGEEKGACRTAAIFHHLWMGARGKAKMTRHRLPQICLPFPESCRFFPTLPPTWCPPQQTHLEKGTLFRWEAVPVRRRQAPASPENSHPMN